MKYLGDYDTSTVIYGKFTTFRPTTGAAFTLGGTPALSVYKDNSTTQSTTGVTLTVDFDSVTGLHHFAIDTSADGTFYAAGSNFDIVITTGTVDSVSVVGTVVGGFTLRKDSSLKPTTAARTLDVSATGEAGIDWANIGSPTTAVNLSATNIDVDQVVASVSGAVGSVTGLTAANLDVAVSTRMATYTQPAGFLAATFPSGTIANTTNITAGTITTATNVTTVNGLAANVITAASTAADYVTEIQSGLATSAALVSEINDVQTDIAALSIPTAATIADAVWDEAIAGHLGAGSTGESLNAAGGAGDPWITALPGAYAAGTAGYIVGNNIDTPLSTIDTVVDAIKAKTDSLTFTVVGQVDSNAKSMNDAEIFGDGTSGDLWRG